MAQKVIVTQVGARHRYLIPRILEKNNLLYRFYTDSNRYSFLGRIASLLRKLGVRLSFIDRLCKRNPNIERKRLYSSDSITYSRAWYNLLKKSAFDRV